MAKKTQGWKRKGQLLRGHETEQKPKGSKGVTCEEPSSKHKDTGVRLAWCIQGAAGVPAQLG